MESPLGRFNDDNMVLGLTTGLPGLMVRKSLWITPYAVLGALRPPEEKKARLRLTATPRYPGQRLCYCLLLWCVSWLGWPWGDRRNLAGEELSHARRPGLMPARRRISAGGADLDIGQKKEGRTKLGRMHNQRGWIQHAASLI